MTRFVIDAPTLLHIVEHEVLIHADHQLVAASIIRAQALVTVDAAMADRADGLVRLATLAELSVESPSG